MINSVEIKNYRSLKNLRLDDLSSVNLITGKNNTGKSTLLEAIALYASRGDRFLINELLQNRGENFKKFEENKDPTELNIKTLSSLFTYRYAGFEKENELSIFASNSDFENLIPSQNKLSLRFVNYFEEILRDDKGLAIGNINRIVENAYLHSNLKKGFELKFDENSHIIPLDKDRPFSGYGTIELDNSDPLEFIGTRNIDREINGRLWDNVALTQKELYVIEALQIIEPSTERITFIEENRGERLAIIKLSTSHIVVPLKSMGDGINRILTIILALVNAEKGFLFIDEFENGLHHTVQEKLWSIIFTLSQKLNIQVFATTHSEDCIIGFENVINNADDLQLGKLIRLDNVNGEIIQVQFDARELRIANESDIEIR